MYILSIFQEVKNVSKRIILLAHTPLASAMSAAALHIFPEANNDIIAIDVNPGTSPSEISLQCITALNPKKFTLILTDIYGASPCNGALFNNDLMNDPFVKILTGMNLPMVIRAINYEGKELSEWASLACEGGLRGIAMIDSTELR